MVEVVRVGDKRFRIDKSKMSSSRIRRIRAQIKRERARLAIATQRENNRVLKERLARKRQRLEARQRRETRRLAPSRYLGEKPTGAGGRSSTFEDAVRRSRQPLEERRLQRAENRLERQLQRMEEREMRARERKAAQEFPGFKGRPGREVIKDVAEAQKQGGPVRTSLGFSPFRLLPPKSQGGGGLIRELHARDRVPFGGGMEGQLTPESAQQLGFQRIQRRIAERQPELDPFPVREVAAREGERVVFEVEDTRTGEVKQFKSEAAATGFAVRQAEAQRERLLRERRPQERITQVVRAPATAPPLPVQGMALLKAPREPEKARPKVRTTPLGVELPFIGRVEEPFISPVLGEASRQAQEVIAVTDAQLRRATTRKERQLIMARRRRALDDISAVRLDITRESGPSRPILQRISQLDVPGVDIRPTPGAEAAITGSVLGISATTGTLPAVAVGATTGRKVAQETGSPALGLAAAFLSAGLTQAGARRLTRAREASAAKAAAKSTKTPSGPTTTELRMGVEPFRLKELRGVVKSKKPGVNLFGKKPPGAIKAKGQLSVIKEKVATSKTLRRLRTKIEGRLPKTGEAAKRQAFRETFYPRDTSLKVATVPKAAKSTGRLLGRKGSLQLQTITKAPTKVTTGTISALGLGQRSLTLTRASPLLPASLAATQTGLVRLQAQKRPLVTERLTFQRPKKKLKTPQKAVIPLVAPVKVEKKILTPVLKQPQKVVQKTPLVTPTLLKTPSILFTPTVLTTPKPGRPKTPRKPPVGGVFPGGGDFANYGIRRRDTGFKALAGLATGKEVLDITFGKKRRGKKKGGWLL